MNKPDFINLHHESVQAQTQPLTGANMPGQMERQFIGGLLNTALDLGVFAVLTAATGALASVPVVAKAASYLLGVANNLVMNHVWSSPSARPVKPSTFVLSSLIGLGINVSIMQLALLAALPQTAALGLATAAALVWNWSASRTLLKSTTR